MAEFIHLVNDISTPVKLGWAVVLVWGTVQIMWYRHGRIVPGEAQSASGAWSAARLFAALTRAGEGSQPGRFPLSIAPVRQYAPEADVVPTAASGHANEMWETTETDWFDEELRMSEMRSRSERHAAGSTRGPGDLTPDAPEARQ
jgi:hypothetical protein